MLYEPKNFDNLLGIFSDVLLKNHFSLYQGYVSNTNKLLDELKGKEGPVFSELKRRFGWEFDGMRLHELYFGNMSKNPKKLNGRLLKQIEKDFGSYSAWEKDFKATGSMRGIGWVVLYSDNGRLFNCWVNEHDVGHLAGCTPLLVMDVFEHAYLTDFGIKKADYIEAFMKAIDWDAIAKRL
jgi:Fe-Mn family superoxide dismutase